MSHDSLLILPLIMIHNSWIILLNHHLYSTSLWALSKKQWIMIHESWIILPLTLPRTLTLLPWSIPESFIVIGPATCQPIGKKGQDSQSPPTPPYIPTPASLAGSTKSTFVINGEGYQCIKTVCPHMRASLMPALPPLRQRRILYRSFRPLFYRY